MYPVDFPLPELKNIINIVRNNEIAAKKEDFAHDVWWVQGYAQSKLVGAPPELVAQAAKAAKLEPVALLEKIVADHEAVKAQGLVDNIPWKQFLAWALQQLLDRYLS